MDRLEELSGGVSPILTSLSLGFEVPGTVGLQVMPFHALEGDRAIVIDRTADTEAYKLHDTKMGLRSRPRSIDFAVGTTPVLLIMHGLSSDYGTQEAERGASIGLDVASEAAAAAQTGVLVYREYEIAAAVQNSAYYAGGHSVTVTGGNGWNEETSGVSNVDPIKNATYGLLTGYNAIRTKIGTGPNQCVMGATAFQAFCNNTWITGRLGQNITVREVDHASALAILQKSMPSIKTLIVGESSYNDGTSFVDCWGDFCRLAYVDPNPQPRKRTPTWGYVLARRYAMQDGKPVLGIAGNWRIDDFSSYAWYTEQYLVWPSWTSAGYLISDVVQ
jgi:hypothetical protein